MKQKIFIVWICLGFFWFGAGIAKAKMQIGHLSSLAIMLEECIKGLSGTLLAK